MADHTNPTRSAQRLVATLLALGVTAVGLGSMLPVDKPGVSAPKPANAAVTK